MGVPPCPLLLGAVVVHLASAMPLVLLSPLVRFTDDGPLMASCTVALATAIPFESFTVVRITTVSPRLNVDVDEKTVVLFFLLPVVTYFPMTRLVHRPWAPRPGFHICGHGIRPNPRTCCGLDVYTYTPLRAAPMHPIAPCQRWGLPDTLAIGCQTPPFTLNCTCVTAAGSKTRARIGFDAHWVTVYA